MADISCEAENVSKYRPQSNAYSGQISVHTDRINPQLSPQPETRFPILERLKAQRFGAGGYGGRYSVERRIPKVLPIGEWGVGKNIATLPAVQSILSGPEKGLLAQYNGRSEYVKSHDRPKTAHPYPTGRFKWGTKQNIARLPSASVGGKYPVSNERSLSPQGVRDISRKTTSARISVQV